MTIASQAAEVSGAVSLLQGAPIPPWPPGGNESLRWNATEFHSVAKEFSDTFAATAGREGLTLEVPWNEGESDGETSLIRLNGQEHPLWGMGLAFRLDLPETVAEEEVDRLCDALNRADGNAMSGPPLFGAWHPNEQNDGPAFGGFLLNDLWAPGLASQVTGWLIERNRWARSLA